MPKLPAGGSDGGAGTGRTFWEVEGEDGGSQERRMKRVLREGSGSVDERGGRFQGLVGISCSSCSRSRRCLIETIGKAESYHCETL
ncbi:hypothetical protein F2Q69_00043792 [Brassica cretica]|uniref:Uncharacterized protein n=1 Tax=Brassica cretica TaxID=69181 RepID=A0A8S9NHN7_BRACR|nr:hypothetical protein F2Q69_00043792 [Brassica cretica]